MGRQDTVLLLLAVAVGWLGPLAPPLVHSAPSAHAHDALSAPALTPAALREQGLLRLQKALGLPAPLAAGEAMSGTGNGQRAEAPEFMLQLQRRVAHPDGVLREPATHGTGLPHGAHIVRSFFEQDPVEEQLLRFNVSGLDDAERVLGAELRVFRLRRTRAPLLLRVYQVEEGRGAGADEHRLLGVQATGARAPPGWHSFNVVAAVRSWLAGDSPNLGLLVTASTLDGATARAPPFARRTRHAPRRQPLLVLYDNEATPAPPLAAAALPAHGHHVPSENEVDNAYEEEYYDDEDGDYEDANGGEGSPVEGEEGSEDEAGTAGGRGGVQRSQRRGQRRGRRDAPWSAPRRRQRRHGVGAEVTQNAVNDTATDENVCARRDLWVEFEDIGWSTWIISPAGYNAYQCVGECPYPLGPALGPTNHATVQSIVHALRLQEDTRAPCCTPQELEGLSLLYTNEAGVVVLKIYEDMVARTCGCH